MTQLVKCNFHVPFGYDSSGDRFVQCSGVSSYFIRGGPESPTFVSYFRKVYG